ncbi:MAG: SIS domain-containing protein [Deltaproteobacteria bacterium]|nr:SIS domain-containing protein [Deltaproteobacteria bacterium]
MSMTIKEMNAKAVSELTDVINRIDPVQVDALIEFLAQANRVVCYGVGREGLMMKALNMRLFHMGLDAHVVGDMTTPPVGEGDVLLISAGPGYFSTVAALMGVACSAGAKTICFTAQAGGKVPQSADLAVVLPAQTMADDTTGRTSFLPMGSLYEGVQYLFFEYLVLLLRDHLGVTPEQMRHKHTNLE